MKACVTFKSQLSGEIAIDNGIRQRDIPASTLFSIFLAVLLTHAFKDCDQGIPLWFTTSGKVLNQRRFSTRSDIFVELIIELLYPDDAVFLAHKRNDIQHIIDNFS